MLLNHAIPMLTLSRMPGLRPAPGIHFDGSDGGEAAAGTGDGAVGGAGSGAGESDDENQPRFTQKQLDEVVGRRLEQERRKWDRDFKQKLDEATKPKPTEATDGKEKGKGKDDGVIPRAEYDNLKSQLEKATKDALAEKDDLLADKDKQISALLDEKRSAAVIGAIASLSPVNAKQVAKLVLDSVGFDEDGTIIVLGPDGKSPRYGKDGNYLTIEDYMAEFAKANPHLFKAEVASGGGSRGGTYPGKQQQNLSSTGKIAAGLNQLRRG